MSSAFTMEKILADAKSLVMRLKDYDTTTNSLLTQTQQLGKKVDAMKTVITLMLCKFAGIVTALNERENEKAVIKILRFV